MNDCEHPKCHEHLKICMSKLVTKKAMWIVVVAFGLPLFITGVKVWSEQTSDHLRYVEKTEMIKHEKATAELKGVVTHMINDMAEIKANQKENRSDVKEMLRYMRARE